MQTWCQRLFSVSSLCLHERRRDPPPPVVNGTTSGNYLDIFIHKLQQASKLGWIEGNTFPKNEDVLDRSVIEWLPAGIQRYLHVLVTEHHAAEQTGRNSKWQDRIPVRKSGFCFSPENGRITSQIYLEFILNVKESWIYLCVIWLSGLVFTS